MFKFACCLSFLAGYKFVEWYYYDERRYKFENGDFKIKLYGPSNFGANGEKYIRIYYSGSEILRAWTEPTWFGKKGFIWHYLDNISNATVTEKIFN